jgi:uncharacterized OsmC-like protein
MQMYKAEIKSNPDSSFEVSADGYNFTVDTKGKGVTPPAALLASLGSCIGVYLRRYLQGAKAEEAQDFKIIVEAEFSKEAPVSFKDINVSLELGGIALDERRRRALLEFIKNCPVHNTLKNSPEIKFTLK